MKCKECQLMQRMENTEDQENFSRIEGFPLCHGWRFTR